MTASENRESSVGTRPTFWARRRKEALLKEGLSSKQDELAVPKYVGHGPATPEQVRGPEEVRL